MHMSVMCMGFVQLSTPQLKIVSTPLLCHTLVVVTYGSFTEKHGARHLWQCLELQFL